MDRAGPAECDINEESAWALIRAACDCAFGPGAVALRVSTGDKDIAIEVVTGGGWSTDISISAPAARLLDIYLPYAASGRTPTVLAQIGQSLDGFIATVKGHSHYITGESGLDHLHRLRALSDVVVVGAGTAVADDPRLTVRRTEGRNPVRAVIDVTGRVPLDQQMFQDGAAPTLILTSPERASAMSVPDGVEAIGIDARDGTVAPDVVIEALAARGLNRILIEGGGVTISHFLQAGLLNRLHVCVAPLIIGAGHPALSLPPIDHLNDAIRPPCRHHRMGDDMLFDLELG